MRCAATTSRVGLGLRDLSSRGEARGARVASHGDGTGPGSPSEHRDLGEARGANTALGPSWREPRPTLVGDHEDDSEGEGYEWPCFLGTRVPTAPRPATTAPRSAARASRSTRRSTHHLAATNAVNPSVAQDDVPQPRVVNHVSIKGGNNVGHEHDNAAEAPG